MRTITSYSAKGRTRPQARNYHNSYYFWGNSENCKVGIRNYNDKNFAINYMSVALYRKYRPKTFGEVTNQNHIKITLQNEIETGHLGHAYLFCGPRGTGKTTLARLLAKAINCENIAPRGEPCNACPSCVEIMAGRALDILEIDAASHTGVENVRENIINNARFTPTKNKFKVFIIDEVHMLSTPAFNALLKTLEEPPKYVLFILATTEIHKIPSTIISRCQRFDFKKIIVSELITRLKWICAQEEVSVDEKVLAIIAKQSGGCVRDAESLLEQVMSLGEKNISAEQAELILPKDNFGLLFQLFEYIIRKQKKEAISFINQLVADGVDINLFTDSFVEFVRKAMLYKVTSDVGELARELEDDMIKKMMALIADTSDLDLVLIIEKCLSTKELFKQSYLTQLPLEIAVLELTTGEKASSVALRFSPPAPNPSPVSPRPIEEKKIEPNFPMTQASPVINVVQDVTEPGISEKASATDAIVSPSPADRSSTIDLVEISSSTAMDVNSFSYIWLQLLRVIKEENYSLYMSLRMGKPVKYDGNRLILGFLFELQRQRVADLKNMNIVKTELTKLAGKTLEIETIVDQGLKLADLSANNISNGETTTPSIGSDQINNIANDFGGTVVETI